MAEDKKCAHPACRCRAREDSKYCSAYCESAGDKVEIQCNCGHSDCGLNPEAALT